MGNHVTNIRDVWIVAGCLLLLLLQLTPPARAEGKIGCLFSDGLCMNEIEWCFDDYVFGKCLPQFGVDQEDMERMTMNEEQSHTLLNMLEELQGAGLGWNHVFVQCRMQGALFSMQNDKPMPPNLCAALVPDPKVLDPQSRLAFVRFIPPVADGFADEVYSPPNKKHAREDPYGKGIPSAELLQIVAENERQAEDDAERSFELSNQERFRNQVKDIKNRIELRRMLAEYEAGNLPPPKYNTYNQEVENAKSTDYTRDDLIPNQYNFMPHAHGPAYKRVGVKTEFESSNDQYSPDEPRSSFREKSREFNIPKVVLDQAALSQAVESSNEVPMQSMLLSVAGNEATNELPPESGVYTEGGLVFVPDVDAKKQAARSHLLNNILGFTRHERLDVKKPGPGISFKPHDAESEDKVAKDLSVLFTPKIKKIVHSMNDHGTHSVETDFTYVKLRSPIENWGDGPRIVTAIAKVLNMENYFTFSRVDRHEITFRVQKNPDKKTALDIAKAIDDPRFKNTLSRLFGLTVLETGIGDKTKIPLNESITKVLKNPDDVSWMIFYIFLGAGTAAVLLCIGMAILIRRNDRKRDKLGGLQAGLINNESNTKDYQDLCRTRMAAKNPNGSGESGRIASLTKENDKQQTSSRSSVSSWSEEPATNMDISTGHMVLSYMEDHLKNKGRLQREWEALCRYEAEPSSREAAMQPQCEPLNRSSAPLPYDHSRVVVNHLANTEGLDYINASTITDHDPRAPAYIAAQGPLPSTLAHFWQMVWEQGSVVIVMLCRLQEMGGIACARYWPEEGSEVYHIYEVHLVSEHIWCEDYLVRSFYLKNLRTSETRTVTQFHFLSWPEFGFPAAAKTLLEFRRKVNKSYRGRSCPVIVHSSNGAGRTGSYILLDLVLARMNKGAREIDIAATLEHLRDQRPGLVATPQQFEFVLMAVAEEVHAILKALPVNTQPEKRELDNDTVKELEQADKRDGNTEKQDAGKE